MGLPAIRNNFQEMPTRKKVAVATGAVASVAAVAATALAYSKGKQTVPYMRADVFSKTGVPGAKKLNFFQTVGEGFKAYTKQASNFVKQQKLNNVFSENKNAQRMTKDEYNVAHTKEVKKSWDAFSKKAEKGKKVVISEATNGAKKAVREITPEMKAAQAAYKESLLAKYGNKL